MSEAGAQPRLSDDQRQKTLKRFAEHKAAWDRNPALRMLYADWYGRVKSELPAVSLGPRIEIGSGPGFARAFIPDLVLTDVVAAPWHDREMAGEEQPFPDGSVGALVMLDVLHHLSSPTRFFAEATRVLRPGGRIVLCEPFIGPLSEGIYRYLHPEGLDLSVDPFDLSGASAKDPFDANQAIPTLLFARGGHEMESRFPNLALRSVERLAGPSYPASGGFSRSPFLPWGVWQALHRLESKLPQAVFRVIGFRMLVVIDRC